MPRQKDSTKKRKVFLEYGLEVNRVLAGERKELREVGWIGTPTTITRSIASRLGDLTEECPVSSARWTELRRAEVADAPWTRHSSVSAAATASGVPCAALHAHLIRGTPDDVGALQGWECRQVDVPLPTPPPVEDRDVDLTPLPARPVGASNDEASKQRPEPGAVAQATAAAAPPPPPPLGCAAIGARVRVAQGGVLGARVRVGRVPGTAATLGGGFATLVARSRGAPGYAHVRFEGSADGEIESCKLT